MFKFERAGIMNELSSFTFFSNAFGREELVKFSSSVPMWCIHCNTPYSKGRIGLIKPVFRF